VIDHLCRLHLAEEEGERNNREPAALNARPLAMLHGAVTHHHPKEESPKAAQLRPAQPRHKIIAQNSETQGNPPVQTFGFWSEYARCH
jgi:hypothetical protein